MDQTLAKKNHEKLSIQHASKPNALSGFTQTSCRSLEPCMSPSPIGSSRSSKESLVAVASEIELPVERPAARLSNQALVAVAVAARPSNQALVAVAAPELPTPRP
jgi:hypothetical protein